MYFNRHDIVEAWYLALSECHGGQWSREYARLCKILTYYRPSPIFSKRSLTENAREIYEAACITLLYNELKDEYGA